jgi:REP element-mobilizing transposase RayT
MLKRDELTFFNVIYGLLWPTKRGKPLLVNEIAAECRRLIVETCEKRGWEIFRLEVHPNHIVLVLATDPGSSPRDVFIACREQTSVLFHKYSEEMRPVSSLWTRNFAAVTLAPETDIESLAILSPEEMADMIKLAKLW